MEVSPVTAVLSGGAQLPQHLALPRTPISCPLPPPGQPREKMPSGRVWRPPRAGTSGLTERHESQAPRCVPGPRVTQSLQAVLGQQCVPAHRGGALPPLAEGGLQRCPWRGDTEVRALLRRRQDWWGRACTLSRVHAHTVMQRPDLQGVDPIEEPEGGGAAWRKDRCGEWPGAFGPCLTGFSWVECHLIWALERAVWVVPRRWAGRLLGWLHVSDDRWYRQIGTRGPRP